MKADFPTLAEPYKMKAALVILFLAQLMKLDASEKKTFTHTHTLKRGILNIK